MTSKAPALIVQREINIAATPDTVFQYLVDPARMVAWMGQEAKADPRPGGIYRVKVNDTHIAEGKFVAVEPPTRVVFTWGWEGEGGVPPGSSTVEITLKPDGEGTLLRLVHRDLPDEKSIQSHYHGWEHYVGRLAKAAAGEEPGPDTMGACA